MLQPQDITKSKRFARDKLNISDIQGTKPDVYKKLRQIEGREYIDTQDIDGAKPSQLKQNKPHYGPDYKLYTKDINPDKWQSKRIVDPLKPEYVIPTKSGRMMRIGHIERSAPKATISPGTKRIANYIGDIDGSRPKKGTSITEDQRNQAIGLGGDFTIKPQSIENTRNTIVYNPPQKEAVSQQEILKQSLNHSGPVPNSHYARFQTYQNNQPMETPSWQPIPQNSIKTGYRQNITSSSANKEMNNYVISGQVRESLNDRGQSKRMNTYQLLQQNQISQQDSNTSNEANRQYFNAYPPPKSHAMRYGENANNSSSVQNSPDIRENRVWSKARNIGNQEISQQEQRLNSSNSQPKGLDASINLKRNFNENIYQKGLLMNSGHKSFINSGYSQLNPLNNEVNRSVDSAGIARQYQTREDRLSMSKPQFNPLTAQAINYGTTQINRSGVSQSSNISPQKSILPPTTSKAYGNFMDGKQLDQMISQLKQANSHASIF